MYKILILAVVIFGVSFASVSNATDNSGAARGEKLNKIFSKLDTNSDGKISLDEFLAKHKERFENKDADSDGYLTEEEMRPKHRGGKRGSMGRSGKPADMPEPPEDVSEDME